DALEERDIDAVDRRYRLQPLALGVPDEGVGGLDVVLGGRRGRQTVKCVCDAPEERLVARLVGHIGEGSLQIFVQVLTQKGSLATRRWRLPMGSAPLLFAIKPRR